MDNIMDGKAIEKYINQHIDQILLPQGTLKQFLAKLSTKEKKLQRQQYI